jgi:hypothetical protein
VLRVGHYCNVGLSASTDFIVTQVGFLQCEKMAVHIEKFGTLSPDNVSIVTCLSHTSETAACVKEPPMAMTTIQSAAGENLNDMPQTHAETVLEMSKVDIKAIILAVGNILVVGAGLYLALHFFKLL